MLQRCKRRQCLNKMKIFIDWKPKNKPKRNSRAEKYNIQKLKLYQGHSMVGPSRQKKRNQWTQRLKLPSLMNTSKRLKKNKESPGAYGRSSTWPTNVREESHTEKRERKGERKYLKKQGQQVIGFEETHDYKHPGSSTDFM